MVGEAAQPVGKANTSRERKHFSDPTSSSRTPFRNATNGERSRRHDPITQRVQRLNPLSKLRRRRTSNVQIRESPVHVYHERPRDHWRHRSDFLFLLSNFAVGMASVWRFPALCYVNGGAIFLIPFLMLSLLGALPLIYMEVALGQFNRTGMITVWQVCPIFRGIGIAVVLFSFFTASYYNAVLAWTIFYLVQCCNPKIDWLNCNNTWNTERCVDEFSVQNGSLLRNGSQVTAAVEYYERRMLAIHESEGFMDMGYPRWELVLCLLGVFVFTYLILFSGVRFLGRIAWIFLFIPFMALMLMLVQGCLLPGAWDGILLVFNPDPSKLIILKVWVDAAIQVFFSTGVGFGAHFTYATYNEFTNDCYRQCLIVMAINFISSIIAVGVAFAYVGSLAYRDGWNLTATKLNLHEPGVLFEIYPEAIGTLENPRFYSIILFVMLFTLGSGRIDAVECATTASMDTFNHFFVRWRFSRLAFVSLILIPSYLLSIFFLTPGGGYLLKWFSTYTWAMANMLTAFLQVIAVSWFYGVEQFGSDIHNMLGFYPGIYWRVCWKYISPLFIMVVFVFAVSSHPPLRYKSYAYPTWSIIVGWMWSLWTVALVPAWAIFYLARGKESLRTRLILGISPEREHRSILRRLRRGLPVKRLTAKHWYGIGWR